MSKSTKPQTEITASQAMAAPPAPAEQPLTIEVIEQRLTRFLQETAALKDKIGRALQQAEEATRRADRLYIEAGSLEARGEVDQAHEKLKAIKPLREKARQLRAGVGDYEAELGPLVEIERTLRAAAHQLLQAAECEIEAAKARRNRAARAFGDVGANDLGRVRDLLGKWRESMGIEEPKPAPVEQPKTRADNRPDCPRCRRNLTVESVGLDRWRCRAAFHGPLDFNTQGTILPRRHAEATEPKETRTAAAVA